MRGDGIQLAKPATSAQFRVFANDRRRVRELTDARLCGDLPSGCRASPQRCRMIVDDLAAQADSCSLPANQHRSVWVFQQGYCSIPARYTLSDRRRGAGAKSVTPMCQTETGHPLRFEQDEPGVWFARFGQHNLLACVGAIKQAGELRLRVVNVDRSCRTSLIANYASVDLKIIRGVGVRTAVAVALVTMRNPA